jgi:AraC-like DNA-binding protein
LKARKSILVDDLMINYDKKDYGMTMHTFHYHNVYEIYILTSGKRNLVINEMIYDTCEYDVAMIAPEKFHRSYGNTPYSGICLNFSENYLNQSFTDSAKKKLLACFLKPVISLDSDSMDEIHKFADKIISNPKRKFIYLSYILDILNDFAEKTNEKFKITTCPELSPIMIYIKDNFIDIKSLDDVAKSLFMSKNYLCTLFKKQTGMTVNYYINSLRVQFACVYLSETSDTVSEISIRCGFESPSYFNKVFKKFIGYTPVEFRKIYQWKKDGID